MADETVPPMTMVHVSPQESGHQGGQLLGVVQLQKQMEVIGHQTIVIQPEAKASAVAIDQGQERLVIFVAEENSLAVVTSAESL